MDTITIEMPNGLTVTVLANDPEIVDHIIPRYELTAALNGAPLLDPETKIPVKYGVSENPDEMRAVMDHFSDLEFYNIH